MNRCQRFRIGSSHIENWSKLMDPSSIWGYCDYWTKLLYWSSVRTSVAFWTLQNLANQLRMIAMSDLLSVKQSSGYFSYQQKIRFYVLLLKYQSHQNIDSILVGHFYKIHTNFSLSMVYFKSFPLGYLFQCIRRKQHCPLKL